jgi:hypothetical protein
MNVIAAAITASEAGEGTPVSPFLFGAVGLGVLLLLLVITVLINVDR